MDFYPFTGEGDVLNWFFHLEHYFTFYRTHEDGKVTTALFYIKDAALQWCRWQMNPAGVTWPHLRQSIIERYGSHEYQVAARSLSCLQQSSTVKEYQERFERLQCLVAGVPLSFLTQTSIGGRRGEIQYEVVLQQPTTLLKAFKATQLVETKVNGLCRFRRPFQPRSTAAPFTPNSSTLPPSSSNTPKHPLPTLRKLTTNEVWKRHRNGLCFH